MYVANCDPDKMGTLEFLLEKQVVAKVADNGAVSSWQVTTEGQGAIESCMHSCTSQLVATPRVDIALDQMTVYDLIYLLEGRGWVARVWRRGQHDRDRSEPFHITKVAPKVWWVNPTTRVVSRPYLYALAAADQAHCEVIEHLKTDSYYKDLLNGEGQRRCGHGHPHGGLRE